MSTGTATKSAPELLADLNGKVDEALAEMKAQRLANDKAVAAIGKQVSSVVTKQAAYDAKLEDLTKRVDTALNQLGRKVVEATKSIDLEGQAERVATRLEGSLKGGHGLADRLEAVRKFGWPQAADVARAFMPPLLLVVAIVWGLMLASSLGKFIAEKVGLTTAGSWIWGELMAAEGFVATTGWLLGGVLFLAAVVAALAGFVVLVWRGSFNWIEHVSRKLR